MEKQLVELCEHEPKTKSAFIYKTGPVKASLAMLYITSIFTSEDASWQKSYQKNLYEFLLKK